MPDPYQFESTILEREAFRLLSIIHSSKSLAKLHKQSKAESTNSDYMRRLAGRIEYLLLWEENECSRILITLAIIVRNSLEGSPGQPDGGLFGSACYTLRGEPTIAPPNPFPPSLAGTLRYMMQAGADEEGLNVRQTCNKIIHAKEVEWRRDRLDTESALFLTGEILLYGEEVKGNPWITWFRVDDFCLDTLSFF